MALRHTLLNCHLLCSGYRPGLEQETWALLTLYLLLHLLLRMTMVTAVETRAGIDRDRASFTTALEAARAQVTAARCLPRRYRRPVATSSMVAKRIAGAASPTRSSSSSRRASVARGAAPRLCGCHQRWSIAPGPVRRASVTIRWT